MRFTPLIALVIPLLTLPACGKKSTPSGPGSSGSGGCRTYASSATVNTSPLAIFKDQPLTATFDTATHQATVTVLSGALFGNTLCSTGVLTYTSNADFVDEAKVVPPITLAKSQSTTTSGICGGAGGTATYTYDSQRRLTRVTASTGAVTTYTAWDSAGRPTAGSYSTGGTITNVHDSNARTTVQTQVIGGTTNVSTLFYDANGLLLKTVEQGGQTTTYTTLTTATVCS